MFLCVFADTASYCECRVENVSQGSEIIRRAEELLYEWIREQRPDLLDSAIKLHLCTATTWPNRALGCPQPGMFYAQVLTPGYRIVFKVGEEFFIFHSDYLGYMVLYQD